MNVSVQSLLDRFGILMHDTTNVRWNQAERLMWVNDGQQELITIKPDACVKSGNITLAIGAKQAYADSSDFYKLVDVKNTDTGTVPLECAKKSLDAFNPSWVGALENAPVKNWMRDENPSVFWVYPAQSTATRTLTVSYAAYPPIAIVTDNIGVRAEYAANLLNYMIYRAYVKDSEVAGNTEKAAAAYALFKG